MLSTMMEVSLTVDSPHKHWVKPIPPDFMKLWIASPLRAPCYPDKSIGLTFTSALQSLSKKREQERERGKYHLRCCLIEKGRISQTLSSGFPVHSGDESWGAHEPSVDHPGSRLSSWRVWTQSFPSVPPAQAPGIPVSCTPASKSFLGCVPLEQILSCFPCSLSSCQRFNLNGSPREPRAWKERLETYDSCSQKYKPIFTELYKHPILINSSAAFLKSHSKYNWAVYTTEGKM